MGSDDSDSADIKIATPAEANGATRKWEIKERRKLFYFYFISF